MKLLLISILFIIGSESVQAEEMKFLMVSNGGNCYGCQWISAEGDITEETPKKLELALKDWGGRSSVPTVSFHSSGGNLLAGLKMGEILRKYKAKANIGKTVVEYETSTRKIYDYGDSGYCLSSCAYAFLGAEKRLVGKNELGFHQFYDKKAILKGFFSQEFTATDRMIDQFLTGIIVEYLDQMGIDISLYTLITTIPPQKIYYLSEAELKKYEINKNLLNETTTDWELVAYQKGLVAEVKSNETNYRTARLYCESSSDSTRYYLTAKIPNPYLNQSYAYIKEVLESYKALTLNDYHIIKTNLYLSKKKQKYTIVFEITKKTAIELAKSENISLGVGESENLPTAYFEAFRIISFGKIMGDKRLPKITLNNCI